MSSDPNTKSSFVLFEKTVLTIAVFAAAVGLATAGGVLLDLWLHG